MATRSREKFHHLRHPGQILWKLTDAIRQSGERRTLSPTAALGRKGEDLAHRYLKGIGMSVLARNYRSGGGEAEVDIIARDGTTLVFVEVKARSSADFGEPDRAVGEEKQRNIIRAARNYAVRAGVEWSCVRFDIVAVVFSQPPKLVHLPDAFFHGRALPNVSAPPPA